MTRRALALALLVLAACARTDGPEPAAEVAGPRAVFLGSSTTAGTGASRPSRRWTAVVARDLGWIEVNLGLPGSKLAALGDRIAAGEERVHEVLAESPDVVVVMYGANDAAAGIPVGDPEAAETFHRAARTLLSRLRADLPAALLVVVSPQPAESLRGVRAPYDAALEREALAAGAIFVPGLDAFPEGQLPRHAADRIHLNDRGHAALARHVRGAIAAALRAGDEEGELARAGGP